MRHWKCLGSPGAVARFAAARDLVYKEDLRTLLRHGTSAAETRDFLDILPDLKDAVADVRAAVAVHLRTAAVL